MARIPEEQILEAGTRAFGELGFQSASMERIATEAATTKPTLYARFGDKAALLQACLDREQELVIEHLFTAYEGAATASAREQVRADVLAIFDYARQRPHGFCLLFGDWSTHEVIRTRAHVVARIEERIVEAFLRWAASSMARPGVVVSREAAQLLAQLSVATSLRGAAGAIGQSAGVAQARGDATATFVVSALRHVDVTRLSSDPRQRD